MKLITTRIHPNTTPQPSSGQAAPLGLIKLKGKDKKEEKERGKKENKKEGKERRGRKEGM